MIQSCLYGYLTSNGYLGYFGNCNRSNGYWSFFGNYNYDRMLFPTEQEYIEYMKEKEEEDGRREEERLKDRRKAHA